MPPNPLQRAQRQRPRPSPPTTDTLVAIQIISVRWDKRSRGGPRAIVRNQMPEAVEMPLPDTNIVEPSFVVHTSKHSVDPIYVGSRVPHKALLVLPIAERFTCGSVAVHLDDDSVHVDYHWSSDAGMPERYSRRDVLVLEKGQWGRVRFNERHSPYYTANGFDLGEWWYEKWVFNIGFFPALEPRAFMDTEPAHIHSQMQLLR